MSNFYKLYANTEGFVVADGNIKGGLFLRSVCKLFKRQEFVLKHNWDDMVLKIREYTKRDATINSNLVNFTQMVENGGTLERVVQFKVHNIV